MMIYHMTGAYPADSAVPDPDYCHYGAGVFLPLLRHLEGELQGVVRDDDPEYVHRCRVATRRIRAAMPLFPSCFPPRRRKKWERRIRILTRSLGAARDLDVQIAFVRSVLDERRAPDDPSPAVFSPAEVVSSRSSHTALAPLPDAPGITLRSRIRTWIRGRRVTGTRLPVPSDPALSPSPDPHPVPSDPAVTGLECLLLRLIQQRRVMQPAVAEVATGFIGSGVIEDFSRYLQEVKVHSLLRGTGTISQASYESVFLRIMAGIGSLLWYEQYLSDPSSVDQHHAMRIMAKKLRYTLEAYSGLYPRSLKGEIRVIKRLQDLLGDIHDCDVWTSLLPRFLDEEESRSVAFFGNHRFFDQVRPGILMLTEDRKNTRAELFRELGRYWGELKEEGFWDQFHETISSPLEFPFSGRGDGNREGPVTIAVISDVHANLPALEAVLEDAGSRGAAVLLNAGDMTGYGPFPEEVVDLIRGRHILSVAGNYDLQVLSRKWKTGRPRSREKRLAMRWAYRNLSQENRNWLKNLPRLLRLPVRGLTLLVTHGSPDSITEYLDDGTPESRLREIAARAGARVVVTGHSHRPAAREVDGVWFVNPGSVGRSEDGDTRASYALITVEPFSLTHIRVPYDIERTIAAVHSRNLPAIFARIISEGRPLDMVRESRRQS